MAEFFLEVRAEEIPARMVASASRRLASAFFETLVTRGLPPDAVENHFTVRRLIVRLTGLVEREPDREEEELGPPASVAWDEAGNATKALNGFAERCGVEPQLVARQQTPKGEYAAVRRTVEGRPMVEILAELAPRLIEELEWSKPMRWGASIGPWVRPVKGVVAMFDGRVVPFEVFGVAAGDTTSGHPILSPEPFEVTDWGDYRRQLSARHVVIEGEERKQTIRSGFEAAASRLGGHVRQDPELLDRLAAMVEIPGVVVGKCDPQGLPEEVLIASLRDHQNAMAVIGEQGPLPAFLTVMDRPDDPQDLVRQGNEWVVAARLEDARFFVAEDRRRSLEQRLPDLERLTFHRQLGSYADKADRVAAFGQWLCSRLEQSELADPMAMAAALAKVDLTCEVVKEFTSLQGVMGGIYAAEQGLPDEVARAIYQQYRPGSPGEPIPNDLLGQLLGVADRMVTLGGFFAIAEVPSGSRDPYALRRAAQGVVEIALGGELSLGLEDLAGRAVSIHDEIASAGIEAATEQLADFLRDRLRSLLGRRGYAYDEVAAAVAVDDLPVAALARVEALHTARQQADFIGVADAAKRIRNILSGVEHGGEVEPALFEHDEEQALWRAVCASRDVVPALVARLDYAAAIDHVATYAPLLEGFFESVLVMADDDSLRTNRLALLTDLDALFAQVGDLSQMAVERST